MGRLMFLDSRRMLHFGDGPGLCGVEDHAGTWNPLDDAVVEDFCEECLIRDGNYYWPDGRLHTVDELAS